MNPANADYTRIFIHYGDTPNDCGAVFVQSTYGPEDKYMYAIPRGCWVNVPTIVYEVLINANKHIVLTSQEKGE